MLLRHLKRYSTCAPGNWCSTTCIIVNLYRSVSRRLLRIMVGAPRGLVSGSMLQGDDRALSQARQAAFSAGRKAFRPTRADRRVLPPADAALPTVTPRPEQSATDGFT